MVVRKVYMVFVNFLWFVYGFHIGVIMIYTVCIRFYMVFVRFDMVCNISFYIVFVKCHVVVLFCFIWVL